LREVVLEQCLRVGDKAEVHRALAENDLLDTVQGCMPAWFFNCDRGPMDFEEN
jgi:hypothetical protein